jgi:hypothetical protein
MKLKTKLKPNSNEIEHKIQTELKTKFKQNSIEIIKHKIQTELKMKLKTKFGPH